MNKLNRLMVGLDLTTMDDTLIQYAAFFCRALGVAEVYFIHVQKSSDLPVELQQGLEPQPAPAGKMIRQYISTRVEAAFQGNTHTTVEIMIQAGSPLEELLHWSKTEQIDLILAGRKLRPGGSGLLPRKLLRTGRVSMLFVPEVIAPSLRRIVLSTDFSDYSNMAMGKLIDDVISRVAEAELICLHVYEVPTGYHSLGMSYEDFDKRMREVAEEKYEKLVLQFPVLRERATFELVRQEDGELGELIVLEARRLSADLLVMGAKGMSAAALFVLGSITEKVLEHNLDIPLAVFKQRDEQIGFLDALLKP